MSPLSTARQFFDSVVSGGAPAIEALITNHQHETEWLDFKSGAHLDKAELTWSRAICGFANNQGGVIVWGIDARKDPKTGIDAACGLSLAENPLSLRTLLMQKIRQAVEPPAVGIEVQEIFRNGTDGPGFVVCLIPESQNKPHRDERAPGKPYTMRIGESFENPSPSLLRNLFYPRSTPQLSVRVVPDWSRVEGPFVETCTEIMVMFMVTVKNSGFVSARDIHLVIQSSPRSAIMGGTYCPAELTDSGAVGVTLTKPLHPTSKEDVARIECRAPVYKVGVEKPYWMPRLNEFEASITVFAADMMPSNLHVYFDSMDIETRIAKTAALRVAP